MNATLMKKVEELTLYLIEKDNDIRELKKQVFRIRQNQEKLFPLKKKVKVLTKAVLKK